MTNKTADTRSDADDDNERRYLHQDIRNSEHVQNEEGGTQLQRIKAFQRTVA